MNKNQMRLQDAGVREQNFAQQLIETKKLPDRISFSDMLDHAVYDASTDTILMTIKGVARSWKVIG